MEDLQRELCTASFSSGPPIAVRLSAEPFVHTCDPGALTQEARVDDRPGRMSHAWRCRPALTRGGNLSALHDGRPDTERHGQTSTRRSWRRLPSLSARVKCVVTCNTAVCQRKQPRCPLRVTPSGASRRHIVIS
ncbi:hypothetical protein MTO96_036001 [Rhipicephalus appendiculatus]